VLTALGAFAYGWERRLENPPYVTTIKGEEPPDIKLFKKAAMTKPLRQSSIPSKMKRKTTSNTRA
jgi:hypothetical protein